MKFALFSKIIIASLALMLAGSAFAINDSHKVNFKISEPTQVNGTQLPAGQYQARWEGSGPAVQVSIIQNMKVVATVPGQLVDRDHAALYNAVETKNNSNGQPELTALLFSGKKYTLQLGSESANAQGKTESTD
ncbi:MAG TPA: hypothetical protein VFB76_00980 [Candidatus Angelobacter sp.]|nr:hypothetical protein [Candidatus Angelobacter sp.]